MIQLCSLSWVENALNAHLSFARYNEEVCTYLMHLLVTKYNVLARALTK